MGSRHARPMMAQETWGMGQGPARSEFETQHWLLAAACPEVHHFSVPNGNNHLHCRTGQETQAAAGHREGAIRLLPFCLWPF